MKKSLLTIICVLLGGIQVLACDVCKGQQPEVLQDVTHGTGPQGVFDYLILWGAVIIVCITLFLSIRFLWRPDKLDKRHPIKFLPLNENG